jgi:hypothetical protein
VLLSWHCPDEWNIVPSRGDSILHASNVQHAQLISRTQTILEDWRSLSYMPAERDVAMPYSEKDLSIVRGESRKHDARKAIATRNARCWGCATCRALYASTVPSCCKGATEL